MGAIAINSFIFLLLLSVFEVSFYPVARALLDLVIDFADVNTDNSHTEKLNTAQKPDGTDNGCPARHSDPKNMGNKGVEKSEYTQKRDYYSKTGDKAQRLTLKDVIPSTAKAIIFLRGYLLSPAKRSWRS